MRIVVDTNIAFSAILNTDSKIAGILLQPKTSLNFYSTEHLLNEIHDHKDKIQVLTDYSDSELERMIRLITNRIRFINVQLIPKIIYTNAEKLTADIDEDDCEFIALTDYIKGKFWSGDKELQKGLTKKNWDKFISTNELFEMMIRKR